MLKKRFLLFTIIILLFTGCHRYNHAPRAIIKPVIIFEPFFIRSHHGYSRGHGNYNRGHRRYNSHNRHRH